MGEKFDGTQGFYAALGVSDGTKSRIGKLQELVESADGLEISPLDELHCTIMFSPREIPASLVVFSGGTATYAVNVALFSQDESTLVLELIPTPRLVNLFNKWKSVGAEGTWPDYRPHITIGKFPGGSSADGKKKVCDLLNSLLQGHPLRVEFTDEYIENANA